MRYHSYLPTFTLNKEDIIKLEKIMKRDASESHEVRITVSFEGYLIENKKIEELLLEPGLPKKIKSMKITLREEDYTKFSFTSTDEEKYVSINARIRSRARLDIQGDWSWINSKKEEIHRFFKLKKNHNQNIRWISGLSFFLSISILFMIIGNIRPYTNLDLKALSFITFLIINVINVLRLEKDFPFSSIITEPIETPKIDIIFFGMVGSILATIFLSAF